MEDLLIKIHRDPPKTHLKPGNLSSWILWSFQTTRDALQLTMDLHFCWRNKNTINFIHTFPLWIDSCLYYLQQDMALLRPDQNIQPAHCKRHISLVCEVGHVQLLNYNQKSSIILYSSHSNLQLQSEENKNYSMVQ